MIPPVLFFFLKIVLGIWGLLCVSIQVLKLFSSTSAKKKKKTLPLYFDRDCTDSVNCLGEYGHFDNIDSSSPTTWHVFPTVSSSISFMSVQKLFHSTGLLPPEVGLFLGILLFLEVMVNGIVSLISLSGTLLLAFCLSRSPLTHGKFTYPVHADNRHTDCSYLPLLLCCLYSILSSFHLVECRTDHCVPRNGMPVCLSAGNLSCLYKDCWLTNASSPWMLQSPIHPSIFLSINLCMHIAFYPSSIHLLIIHPSIVCSSIYHLSTHPSSIYPSSIPSSTWQLSIDPGPILGPGLLSTPDFPLSQGSC